MPRNTRVRRAPNREPTSLAASITVLGSIEAIAIDLALTDSLLTPRSPLTPQSHPSTHSTPLILTNYPLTEAKLDIGYLYPNAPTQGFGKEVS
jgi:hypothetical protein